LENRPRPVPPPPPPPRGPGRAARPPPVGARLVPRHPQGPPLCVRRPKLPRRLVPRGDLSPGVLSPFPTPGGGGPPPPHKKPSPPGFRPPPPRGARTSHLWQPVFWNPKKAQKPPKGPPVPMGLPPFPDAPRRPRVHRPVPRRTPRRRGGSPGPRPPPAGRLVLRPPPGPAPPPPRFRWPMRRKIRPALDAPGFTRRGLPPRVFERANRAPVVCPPAPKPAP